MVDRNRQRGLTTLGWLVSIVAAGFLLICLFKIGPIYMQSMTVNSILDQVAEEARGEGLGKSQIYERFGKKLLINTVTDMTMADVEVRGQGEDIVIDARYEMRKPLLFNIDVVVKFEDMIAELKDY